MFSRSLFVCVLLASSSHAELIHFWDESGSFTTNISEPAKLDFSFVDGSTAATRVLIEEGSIRGVTPGSGTLWVINEANASDYGFDWSATESGVLHRQALRFLVSLASDSGGSGPNTGIPATDFVGGPYGRSDNRGDLFLTRFGRVLGVFDLHEIQIRLISWSLPDVLRERSGSYRYEWLIIGDATFVPEPNSLTLLLLGLLGISRRNRDPAIAAIQSVVRRARFLGAWRSWHVGSLIDPVKRITES